MKVILLQDVAKLGHRFDIVEVPNGHAMNRLVPGGQALPATPENIKRVEARKAHAVAEKTAASESFTDVVARIADSTQTIVMEANEQGHLFQGLKADMIAAELTKLGFAVAAQHVDLVDPIKEVGEHHVTLKDGEHTTTFTLVVAAK